MNVAGIEGRLTVSVRWDGERVVAIELGSERPVEACRVFEGRPAAHVPELVPRLFTLCGRAQTAAAGAALAAAGADPAGAVPDRHRVAVESILESLWRLLHDLPLALDGSPRIEGLVPVRRDLLTSLGENSATTVGFDAAVAALRELLAHEVLGPGDGVPAGDGAAFARWLAARPTPVAGWLADLDAAGLGDWGHAATPLMPARPGEEALRRLAGCLVDDAGFAHQPDWLGRPVETGALAARQDEPLVRQLRQQRGHGCLTRLAARLVDLAALAVDLDGDAPAPLVGGLALGPRTGLGWAQTARGLLLHRVELDHDDRVLTYRVLAPTEWNFHPSGALVQGLEAQPVSSEAELRRGVALAVLALDPCVGHQVEIRPARPAAAGA